MPARPADLIRRSLRSCSRALSGRQRSELLELGAASAICAAIVAVGTAISGPATAAGQAPVLTSAAAAVHWHRTDSRLTPTDVAAARREAVQRTTAQRAARERAARADRARREAARPKWFRPTGLAMTSPFGTRWGRPHTGIDFTGPVGTPVVAAGDGYVVHPEGTAGYGNVVAIAHPDGATTWYCHLSRAAVTSGRVRAGQVIGYIGTTGHVTGPHLHFEVRFGGRPVNPVPWLRGHHIAI